MSCTESSWERSRGQSIELGYRVVVREQHSHEEYTIVERGNVDVARGHISAQSPVGRALLGHRCGQQVSVRTPEGVRSLTIVRVIVPMPAPE